MITHPSADILERMFSELFSNDPRLRASIKDHSAVLPTGKLQSEITAVAKWLNAVMHNAATSGRDRKKDNAIKVENRMRRQLPAQFDPNRCAQLHRLMTEIGRNFLLGDDTVAFQQIDSFLTAQINRRVESPAEHQMSQAS